MDRAIVLLSGGPDSATALGWARQKYEPACLHLNYGQINALRERVCAKKQAAHFQATIEIADIPGLRDIFLDKIGDAVDYNIGCWEVLPFMLGFPLSLAVSYGLTVGATTVILGVHQNDVQDHPEYRLEALDALGEAVRVATHKDVAILAPFVDRPKSEVIRLGTSLQVPYEKSWSCLLDGVAHCGRCWGCARRKIAFHDAGVFDPTEYVDARVFDLSAVDLTTQPSRRGLLFPVG